MNIFDYFFFYLKVYILYKFSYKYNMHTIYKNTNRPPNKLNNIKSIKYHLVKETKEQNQKKKKKERKKNDI